MKKKSKFLKTYSLRNDRFIPQTFISVFTEQRMAAYFCILGTTCGGLFLYFRNNVWRLISVFSGQRVAAYFCIFGTTCGGLFLYFRNNVWRLISVFSEQRVAVYFCIFGTMCGGLFPQAV